jgi:hypothetical protein
MQNILETLSYGQKQKLAFFRSVVEFFKEENSLGLSSYLSSWEEPDIREDVSTLGINQTCALILESLQIAYEDKGELGLIEAGTRWEDYVTDGATWEDFLEFAENRSLEKTSCDCDVINAQGWCVIMNPVEECHSQCCALNQNLQQGEEQQQSGSTFGQWLADLGNTLINIIPTVADAIFSTPDNNYQYTPYTPQYNPQQQGDTNQTNIGQIILYSLLGIGVIVGIILITRKK